MARRGAVLVGLGVLAILLALWIGDAAAVFLNSTAGSVSLHIGLLSLFLGGGTLLTPRSSLHSYVLVALLSLASTVLVTTATIIALDGVDLGFSRIVGFQLAASLGLSPIAAGYVFGLWTGPRNGTKLVAWIGLGGFVGWVVSYSLYLLLYPAGFGESGIHPVFTFVFVYVPLLAAGIAYGTLLVGSLRLTYRYESSQLGSLR